LKHVNDISSVLREMKRMLKKGGKLLIVESTPYTKEQCDIPTMAMRVVEPYHPRFFSKDELNEMITKAGFKVKTHDLNVFRQKWLKKWAKAKNATPEQVERIYRIYKEAPDFFKEEQHVELFDDEKEILNDFPWSIVLAVKT
jgi:Methylase involved in ubiquinone/menaquinone biosynthesis